MFGKKKQKQETLVRMRNLAQLDEGFFAHMKDGKDMFDATALQGRFYLSWSSCPWLFLRSV